MTYTYKISDEFETIADSEAYSPDELANAIAEALEDQPGGNYTINIEAFEEGHRE